MRPIYRKMGVMALALVISNATAATAQSLSQETAKVMAQTLPAANAGNAAAQYQMGELTEPGPGGDYSAAAGWYEKAANNGSAKAAFRLGNLYSLGVLNSTNTPDYVNARFWYAKAAAAGDERGAEYLGAMEIQGQGGPVDKASAAKWLNKFVQEYHQNPDNAVSAQEYQAATTEIQSIEAEQAKATLPMVPTPEPIPPLFTLNNIWKVTVISWHVATWGVQNWLLKEAILFIDIIVIALAFGLGTEWVSSKVQHLQDDEFLPEWLPKPPGVPAFVRRYWFGRWHQNPQSGEWQRVKYYNRKLDRIIVSFAGSDTQRRLDELRYLQRRNASLFWAVIGMIITGYGLNWCQYSGITVLAPTEPGGDLLSYFLVCVVAVSLSFFGMTFLVIALTQRLAYIMGNQDVEGAKVFNKEPKKENFGPQSPVSPVDHPASDDLDYKPLV